MMKLLQRVSLALTLVVLYLGLGWGQVASAQTFSDLKYPDLRITPLIEKLTVEDSRIRRNAAEALVGIGAAAVPSLTTALQSPEIGLRANAATVLGDLGPDAAAAIPDLISLLQDPDAQVRSQATLALGKIGPTAQVAIPDLTQLLKDPDVIVRLYASLSLRKMGIAAKDAVPVLIASLQDANGQIRRNAAYTLGELGVDAADAIPALKTLLDDSTPYVRFAAVKALAGIAQGFQDQASGLSILKLNQLIADFEPAAQVIQQHPDRFAAIDLVYLRRPLNALIAEKDSRFLGKLLGWTQQNHLVLYGLLYALGLPLTWLILLYTVPLKLLQLNNALRPYTDISLPVIGVNLPLRFVLFLSWFHYHPQVLDAWVGKYAAIVRQQFAAKETVKARACHLAAPVALDGASLVSLEVQHLQPFFARQRSRLVIVGEGGGGKTSLAGQIARWAMEPTPAKRLSPELMLPVLIETNLLPVAEKKSALLEAIRGQLQVLMDEPEPLCEELLLRLLRQSRILVIIDNFSELNAETQQAIQPDSPEFPINALVLTSRNPDTLARVNRSTLIPLRLPPQAVPPFLTQYWQQTQSVANPGAVDAFTQLLGSSPITLLLAKLYAAATSENSTDLDLGELALSYLNALNQGLTDHPLENRIIHQATKALAWAAVQQQFQVLPIPRTEALKALTGVGVESAQTVLDYLETRLTLVQTIGAAQEQIQFTLNPLAYCLAAMHLVDLFADHENKWQAGFFQKLGKLQPTGRVSPSFLMAIKICYQNQVIKERVDETTQTKSEDPVWQQLKLI